MWHIKVLPILIPLGMRYINKKNLKEMTIAATQIANNTYFYTFKKVLHIYRNPI